MSACATARRAGRRRNRIRPRAVPEFSKAGTLANAESRVLIGNVHALLPGAVAFLRNDEAGIVLDIGSDSTGRPGSAAPDFSYNTHMFRAGGADLTLEWGRAGTEAAVFRIQANRAVTLAITLPANPWRPFYHYFSPADSGLDAQAVTMQGEYIPWMMRSDPKANVTTLPFSSHAAFEIEITAEHPARIAAGYACLPALGHGRCHSRRRARALRFEPRTGARSLGRLRQRHHRQPEQQPALQQPYQTYGQRDRTQRLAGDPTPTIFRSSRGTAPSTRSWHLLKTPRPRRKPFALCSATSCPTGWFRNWRNGMGARAASSMWAIRIRL